MCSLNQLVHTHLEEAQDVLSDALNIVGDLHNLTVVCISQKQNVCFHIILAEHLLFTCIYYLYLVFT